MLHTLVSKLDRLMPFDTASAHCDIPCKIYDPSTAQLATLTIIRLMDLINEIKEKSALSLADQAQLARLVAQKESHVQQVKEEVRIIWGDYFKSPQFEAHPQIHELTHTTMLKASGCSQSIERGAAEQLLEKVNEFAEVFWSTKNMATKKVICPYPPSVLVVYPDFNA